MDTNILIGLTCVILFIVCAVATVYSLIKRPEKRTEAEKHASTIQTVVALFLTAIFFVATLHTAPGVDVGGLFSITDISNGNYLESAEGDGWIKTKWADTAVASESIYLYNVGQKVGALNDSNTGYIQSTTTDTDGTFSFVDLAPGTYEIYFPEDFDGTDPDYFGALWTVKMPEVPEDDDDQARNFSPANLYVKEFGTFDYTGCSFKDGTAVAEDSSGDDGDNYTIVIQNSEDKTALCAKGYRLVLKTAWANTESNSGATGVDASDITIVSGDESKTKLRHSDDLGYYMLICDWTNDGDKPAFGKEIIYHSGNPSLTQVWTVVIHVPDLSSATYSAGSAGVKVTITFTPILQYKDAEGNWVDAWEAGASEDLQLVITSTA